MGVWSSVHHFLVKLDSAKKIWVIISSIFWAASASRLGRKLPYMSRVMDGFRLLQLHSSRLIVSDELLNLLKLAGDQILSPSQPV